MGALLFALITAVGACAEETPTEPSSTVAVTHTQVFTGALDVGTSTYHTFTAGAAGSVAVTLGSLTNVAGQPLTASVVLGVGQLNADNCALAPSVTARPALEAHLTNAVDAGAYCVSLVDTGSLTETAFYAVRVVHP